MKHIKSTAAVLIQSEIRIMKTIFTIGAALYLALLIMSIGSLYAEGIDPENQRDTAFNIWRNYKSNQLTPDQKNTLTSYGAQLNDKGKKKNIKFSEVDADAEQKGIVNLAMSTAGGNLMDKKAAGEIEISLRNDPRSTPVFGAKEAKLEQVKISSNTEIETSGNKMDFYLVGIEENSMNVEVKDSSSGRSLYKISLPISPNKEEHDKIQKFMSENPGYQIPTDLKGSLQGGKLEFSLPSANTKKYQIAPNSIAFFWIGDEILGLSNLDAIKMEHIKQAKKIQINGGTQNFIKFFEKWKALRTSKGSASNDAFDFLKTLNSGESCPQHI